ncbi:hypothetical protein PvNV_071 [Penaeus vannamei nudivirus]|nr:hypothetical protein PvSNPV_071 [Penaeus vannamei nucleopolyhedrovirus]
MIQLRAVDYRPTSLPKSGYQVINLVGDRYLLILSEGVVQEFKPYKDSIGNAKTVKNLEHITSWVQNNPSLSYFSGTLEVVYNARYIKVIDILTHEGTEFDCTMTLYHERLDYLEQILTEDEHVQILKLNTDSSNLNSIHTPILLRNLDSAYNFGHDLLLNPSNRENVYAIVGSASEPKRPIHLMRKEYTSMADVPEPIRRTFMEEVEIATINEWKAKMFTSGEYTIHTKNDEEYIEFENPNVQEYYLVAGLEGGRLKVFGKVSKNSKVFNSTTNFGEFGNVCENVNFQQDVQNSMSNYEFYDSGYLIGTATPKIVKGALCKIQVLNLMAKTNFKELKYINEIPKLENATMKKKLSTVSTSVLAEEFINRILETSNYGEAVHIIKYIKDNFIKGDDENTTIYMNSADKSNKKRKYEECSGDEQEA